MSPAEGFTLPDLPAIEQLDGYGARFVLWRWQERNGQPDKPPLRVNGQLADSTKPSTWNTRERCEQAVGEVRADGLGFVLAAERDETAGKPVVAGTDLDGCRDPNTGELKPWAVEVVRDLNSYTEVSPSGTGVKVYCLVDPVPRLGANKLVIRPANGTGKAQQIEIFTTGRYFALTGQHLDGTPDEVCDATEAFARLAARVAREGGTKASGSKAGSGSGRASLDKEPPSEATLELLRTDATLAKLWRGEKSHGDPTASGLDWSLALALGRLGMPREELTRVLCHYAHGQIGGGKLKAEAAERRLAQLLDAAAEAEESDGFDLTHDGLALEMGQDWVENARHVALWGQWLNWNKRKWERDEKLRHMTRTRDFLRDKAEELKAWAGRKLKEAEELPEGQERAKALDEAEGMVAWAKGQEKQLRSAPMVAHIVGLARSNEELAAGTAQWDADPWKLNTPAGIVDLRTGTLHPPDPLAYCTKSTAVAPASPGTPAPLWQAFLERIFRHDPELIPFMQRVLGYGLTGLTTEHALIFAWGQGGNGKGVLLNSTSRILGDYAAIAPADLLLVTQSDRHPCDMAMLRAARFVTAQELAPGRAWDEPKLKSLTGGDPITARFIRQDFFTYEPQFLLVVAGNHKPSFKGVDEAIRRRVQLVPFLQNIPAEERDKKLAEKLEAEWPAILRWLIDGCLAWQREGLNPPTSVREASDDYLNAEDVLGQWIAERCLLSAKVEFTPVSQLYADWKEWCSEGGLQPGSAKAFSQRLSERGIKQARRMDGRGFAGIGLLPKAWHREDATSSASEADDGYDGYDGCSDIGRKAREASRNDSRAYTSNKKETVTSVMGDEPPPDEPSRFKL